MSLDLPTCLLKCGLKNHWLFILDEHGIETYDDLQSKKEDMHLTIALKKRAKKEEKHGLMKLLTNDVSSHENSGSEEPGSIASAVSLDLPTCLLKCGLKNRWLFILDKHGIDTYDDLQSKKNDMHLTNALKKLAKVEEKSGLMKLLTKDFQNHEDSDPEEPGILSEDLTSRGEGTSSKKPPMNRTLNHQDNSRLKTSKVQNATKPKQKNVDNVTNYRSNRKITTNTHTENKSSGSEKKRQSNATTQKSLKVSQTQINLQKNICKDMKTTQLPDTGKKKLASKGMSTQLSLHAPKSVKSGYENIRSAMRNDSKDTKLTAASDKLSAFKKTKRGNPESPKIPMPGKKNVIKNKNKQTSKKTILEMLGLCDYYPQKITLQLVMQKSVDKVDKIEDIPWYVLQSLFMLDYRGRYVNNLTSLASKSTNTDNDSSGKSENPRENVSSAIFVKSLLEKVKNVNKASLPHPQDVIVAVFLCSTDFFRQKLSEKMYLCHVSIPLLLPDTEKNKLTCLLWAFKSIISEWEKTDGTFVETPIVNYELPIVTFMRFGNVCRSKSKLMNDIITKGHNTFFHKDLSSELLPPDISNGLADVTWFFPSKGTDSKIDEAVTFINLHGDIATLSKQCHFLKRISSAIIILVSIKELLNEFFISLCNDITNDKKKLVLLICDNSQSVISEFATIFRKFFSELKGNLPLLTPICDFYGSRARTTKELTSDTIDGFLQHLKSGKKISLEKCKIISKECRIDVDDNDEDNANGRILANEVLQHINGKNLDQTKANELPLQGDLWHNWGKLEKEGHRSKEKITEEHSAAVHQKKNEIRRQQLTIIQKPSGLFESFVSNLLNTKGDKRLYFLRWISLYADIISRKALKNLIEDYKKVWTDINDFDRKNENKFNSVEELKEKLIGAEKNLAMTSLGLETLIREIGQAYEAISSLPNEGSVEVRKRLNSLPRIMAELMIEGYPLELLDGDALHVPLSWVSAVLDELKQYIGDKDVFVLSVLGLQSSGKSTLLNTMFGLQFKVNAGISTKGIYAQLIPVPEEGSHTNYDYILVVDTKGLRAPELGLNKYDRDNELGTFAIGLGDMTMINIKGENQTEMQDVLQIVVHAFLRMRVANKLLKLQPSCFFLHQNVGVVNANDKLKFEQKRLEENLNMMTSAAAEQEHFADITSFKDVIDFDSDKNIWYFSDLWQGNPPMAPTNPGYSEKIKEVKQAIFKEAMTRKKGYSKLSDISTRIENLWNGILTENFVFSYKNTLEVRAYTALESFVNDIFWELQNYSLEWFSKEHNNIMNAESQLEQLTEKLSLEFLSHMSVNQEKLKENLMQFFDTSEDREIIVQWKENSFIKLKMKGKEECDSTLQDIQNASKLRKSQLSCIDKIKAYKEDIQNQAKELAKNLRQQNQIISDKDCEEKFNKMWKEQIASLQTNEQSDSSSCDIENIFREVLFKQLLDDLQLLQQHLETCSLSSPVQKLRGNFPIAGEHISVKKRYISSREVTFSNCKDTLEREICKIFDDIENYLSSLKDMCFSRGQVEQVIKMPLRMFNKINEAKLTFMPTTHFKVQLTTFICRYAIPVFKKHRQAYLKKTDPILLTTSLYKRQLQELFKSTLKDTGKEMLVKDMLASSLIKPMDKVVEEKTLIELSNDIRQNNSFLQTKNELLKRVQTDLLQKKCFNNYLLYFCDVKDFLRQWIKDCINNYIFEGDTSKYAELADMHIKLLIEDLKLDVENVTQNLLCQDDLKKWMEMFHDKVKGKFTVAFSDMPFISEDNNFDISTFMTLFLAELDVVQEKLRQRANEVSDIYLMKHKESLYKRIQDQCLGCCEQCPFCNAPCSLAEHDTVIKHRSLQHYPKGARRMKVINSKKLSIETCSLDVASDRKFMNVDTGYALCNFKDYVKIYPQWEIIPDKSMKASLYWKWFMAKFSPQLAKAYDAEEPDIPKAWKLITEEEAIASLEI